MKEIISKIVASNPISPEDASNAMQMIMNGKATNAQIAAFIMGLRIQGETPEIITSCVSIMREHAKKITCDDEHAVDIVGTGGDKSNTFNISTTTAFVVAGAGITVAKHGSYGVSSKCGSANVLKELGVNIDYDIKIIEECIKKINIAFLFAPNLHPAMKYAVPARKELGIWSIFNILGPLCNPAHVRRGVTGVFKPELLPIVAESCRNMNCQHQYIVHGSDGLDEISNTSTTKIIEIKNNKLRSFDFCPTELGIPISSPEEIKGGDPIQNAKITKSILTGEEKGAKKNIVLLNAAFCICSSGKVKTIQEGLTLANDSINSGSALNKLNELIRISSA